MLHLQCLGEVLRKRIVSLLNFVRRTKHVCRQTCETSIDRLALSTARCGTMARTRISQTWWSSARKDGTGTEQKDMAGSARAFALGINNEAVKRGSKGNLLDSSKRQAAEEPSFSATPSATRRLPTPSASSQAWLRLGHSLRSRLDWHFVNMDPFLTTRPLRARADC